VREAQLAEARAADAFSEKIGGEAHGQQEGNHLVVGKSRI
jgi:hypothetical protein